VSLIVQGLGALLVLVVLVDVFSTVLSATHSRGPTGIRTPCDEQEYTNLFRAGRLFRTL